MKTATKKITVMCLALLVVLGVLAGCGADTSTAAGTLQTMLTAMKNGNIQQMEKVMGTEFPDSELTERDAQRLFRAMFGNIDVQVNEKESDGSSAVVTVQGETGDLSSVIPEIGEEIQSLFMDWYQENQEHILEVPAEDIQRRVMEILIQSFEKHTKEMERKPVDTEIQMVKNDDGQWVVDSDSAQSMIYVVFGSDGIENIESLLNNLV